MLTRREVEGELRNLGFRARARRRRADRERALRFVRGVAGVALGVSLLILIGVANLLSSTPSDLAFGHTSSHGEEWVGGGVQSSSSRRASSLFFTGRRTWHPNDPRGRNRHRSDD
jgi:hypothetical protein